MMEPTKNSTVEAVEAVEQLVAENAALRKDLDQARKDSYQEILKANTHYCNWRRSESAAAEYAKALNVVRAERDAAAKKAETAFHAVAEQCEKLCVERLKRGISGTNLAEVGRRAHEMCFRRGFHKPGQMRSYLKRTAHAMEELSEALLAIERNEVPLHTMGRKPEGPLAEFADAVILISEMAYHYSTACAAPGALRPTLDAAVDAKLDYNDRREDGVNGNSV